MKIVRNTIQYANFKFMTHRGIVHVKVAYKIESEPNENEPEKEVGKLKYGISFCSPKDSFSFKRGRELATERLHTGMIIKGKPLTDADTILIGPDLVDFPIREILKSLIAHVANKYLYACFSNRLNIHSFIEKNNA
jgi:hypothetical protein